MGFMLKASSGETLFMSIWVWHPMMLLVGMVLDLDQERFERLQTSLVGGKISPAEAEKLADILDAFIEDFPLDGRITLDGEVTREPKGPPGFEDGDWDRHYSADYDSLVRFRDFCRNSGGFNVG